MSNSFERYAAMNTSGRRKKVRVVESESNAPMMPSPQEKEQRDNTAQFARYRRAVRAESVAMLDGEHGSDYAMLLAILRRMTLTSSAELVNYVRGAKWIKRCDASQKFTVLSVIDAAIIRLRERAGMSPFDDPIFGQPDNVFLVIKKEMSGREEK